MPRSNPNAAPVAAAEVGYLEDAPFGLSETFVLLPLRLKRDRLQFTS